MKKYKNDLKKKDIEKKNNKEIHLFRLNIQKILLQKKKKNILFEFVLVKIPSTINRTMCRLIRWTYFLTVSLGCVQFSCLVAGQKCEPGKCEEDSFCDPGLSRCTSCQEVCDSLNSPSIDLCLTYCTGILL